MTKITKEWLQQTISEFENTRDDIPFGLDEDDEKILEVMKAYLAGMEQDPIAWLNDAYLARGVVDGEAGSEDAGPGYIPAYREPVPQQEVKEEKK